MKAYKDIFERYETKYLLEDFRYRTLIERLKGIAEIDEYGKTSILNIYYDTPDFSIIEKSLEKPTYKEKLRLRSYGIPGDDTGAFIEIKKKYKGIVYKRRVGLKYSEAMKYLNSDERPSEDSQIIREIDYFKKYYSGLKPAMAISYDRIAMKGIHDEDLRITFDENIRWRVDELDLKKGNVGNDILLPGQKLMELKIAGAMSMEMAKILDEIGIRQTSFSKYGRGYTDYIRRESISNNNNEQKEERILSA